MAHNVESMMYAGIAPWHGLGISVPGEQPSREAIRLAGLDWPVEAMPLRAENGNFVDGWRAVVRGTDARVLGVVGERYRPIQNAEAFRFFDELVGDGQAIYHTAGSLDGGSRVWMLAKLPGTVGSLGDATERFLLLTNSHDGSSALRMFFTPVRVVCQNTLNLALVQGQTEGISIRHTSSALSRIEEARNALGLAHSYYERFGVEVQRLAAAPFGDTQIAWLVKALFPGHPDETSMRTQRARDKVVELFAYGRGHEPIRGTAWAALNAVAEYVDHHRATRGVDDQARAEGRLNSLWFGSGAALKRKAHDTIRHLLAA